MAVVRNIKLGKSAITKSVDTSQIFENMEISDEEIDSNVKDVDDEQPNDIIEPKPAIDALQALRNCSVYHKLALEAKAEDVTLSGWKTKSLVDKPNEEEKTNLEDIFNKYNNKMAIYYAVLDFVTYTHGAFELVTTKKGNFVGFKYIRSSTIKMCKGGEKAVQQINADKTYFKVLNNLREHMYEELDAEDGEWSENVPDDRKATSIIWLNDIGPESDYYHEPGYIAATHTIVNEDFIRQYNNNGLVNNEVPNWLITFTGNFEAGERDENGMTSFERDLQKNIEELPNSSGTALVFTMETEDVEGKIEVTAIKLSNEVQEASFEKAKSTNMIEILAAHKVPPGRLGISIDGALGGAVDIERNKKYNEKVIKPFQEKLDDLINQYVVKGIMDIKDWKHEYKEMDIRNLQAEVDIGEKAVNLGAMKPYEFRENIISHLFDLDNQPDGKDIIEIYPNLDQFYYNGQLLGSVAEAGAILKSGNPQAQALTNLPIQVGAILDAVREKIEVLENAAGNNQ